MGNNHNNIVRLIKVLGEGLDLIIYDFQFLLPEFHICGLEIDPEDPSDFCLIEFHQDKEYHYPSEMLSEEQELGLLKELESLI